MILVFHKRQIALLLGCFISSACATFDDEKKSNGKSSTKHPTNNLQCLAQAIHGEARGEAEDGKLLVGRVIATRVHYGYGKNYCDVVYAKKQFAPKKQFTPASFKAAQKSHELGPNGITHFHSYRKKITKRASFTLSPKCKYTGRVGGHWTFACHERRFMSSTNTPEIVSAAETDN